MSTYVKHPTLDGDGTVTIATPTGPVTKPMQGGIFEWPEGVPIHSRYTLAPEPEALREAKRREEMAALENLAKRLGKRVVDFFEGAEDAQSADQPDTAAQPDTADKPDALAGPVPSPKDAKKAK